MTCTQVFFWCWFQLYTLFQVVDDLLFCEIHYFGSLVICFNSYERKWLGILEWELCWALKIDDIHWRGSKNNLKPVQYRVNSNSPRALSNDACNTIVDKTIAKPCPSKFSPYKLNTNKNEASSDSCNQFAQLRGQKIAHSVNYLEQFVSWVYS